MWTMAGYGTGDDTPEPLFGGFVLYDEIIPRALNANQVLVFIIDEAIKQQTLVMLSG